MPAHNAKEVLQSSKATHKAVSFATRKAANRAGRYARDTIRDNIPGRSGGPVGNFPGYAARGTLRAAIITKGPMQRPRAGDWQVQVLVNRNSKASVYARIHEVGGIIRVKRAKYLIFPQPPASAKRSRKIAGNRAFTFQRGGRTFVAAKAVRIKRKRYFVNGWKTALRTLPKRIERDLRREIK